MGKMVQHSYTTGPRKDQTFDAARNISIESLSEEELRQHTHKIVSFHSLIWNVAKAKLPPTAIADFEKSMEGLPRCDWNMRGDRVESNISIRAGEEDLEFSGLALGPPSGVCSRHYARYFTHPMHAFRVHRLSYSGSVIRKGSIHRRTRSSH